MAANALTSLTTATNDEEPHTNTISPPSLLHNMEFPSWFSPNTGIYTSKHPPIDLPTNAHLDLVTHVFSHHHNGSTALVDSSNGSLLSYVELRRMVRSLASGLHRIGIGRKDVVLILLQNTLFFPVVYLGVLSLGAVVSPLNPLSSSGEIESHVKGCGVTFAFTSLGNSEKLKAAGVRAVPVPESMEFSSSEFPIFDFLLSSDPGAAPRPSVRQTDTAALLCSSGTSGKSKEVVLTHRNLISMVELFVRFEASQYGREGWENVYLCALPMFHVYGLSLLATGLLSLGSTIVVMRRFDAEEAARAIERYRVTHFPLVPPMLVALSKAGQSGQHDFGSLKQVSSGAAPLSEEMIQEFMRSFPSVDFIQGYGMTETAAVGTRGFNTGKVKKYMSVGLLAPNMEAKVVDWKNACCLGPGYSGELWLRGPGIMKGYLNDEAATASAINKDGWLITGDIAHFDQDGYLYILDRLKEIIKYNGYQIAPADLESLLICHPDIVDVAVTAAPDEYAGEIPVAFVVRKPGSALSAAEVIAYIAEQVAPYKKVRKVVFVDSVPKSPSGKILRRLLRKHIDSKI